MPSTLFGINTMYVIAGVVVVLLLIIIISNSSAKKRRQAEEEAASASSSPIAFISDAEPVAAPASEPVSGISAKTVAAIMAAVSVASGKPVQQLHFTAIRRINGIQGSWANSGTAEIIATRQTYL